MGDDVFLYSTIGHALGAPLTRREREVVAALLAGHVTHKQIAGALTISVRTVQTHLYVIFAKTGAVSLADLILMALGRKASAVDFGERRGHADR